MSREDPQFKLRMPAELRAQAEQAAKSSGRSLNAELVARIQSSLITDSSAETLISAARARELALMARAGIPDEIRKRVIEGVGRAIRLGHSSVVVSLGDLQMDIGIPDEELDDLISNISEELAQAGYKFNWDDITALCLDF
jgi:VIT1/CCC1 family predicted Fe2+/Mn2+ transporter